MFNLTEQEIINLTHSIRDDEQLILTKNGKTKKIECDIFNVGIRWTIGNEVRLFKHIKHLIENDWEFEIRII